MFTQECTQVGCVPPALYCTGGGVSVQGGLGRGVSIQGGLCPRGGLCWGYPRTETPANRVTHVSKNITLSQTSFGGKNVTIRKWKILTIFPFCI